jgi:adenine-specific DNA glycosylase
MWEFPSQVASSRAGQRATREALDELARAHGVPVAQVSPQEVRVTPLEPVLHKFSHLHVEYRPWVVPIVGRDGSERAQGPEPVRWIAAAAIEELALPVAQQRIVSAALRAFTDGVDRLAG